jgi:hypothetical protein
MNENRRHPLGFAEVDGARLRKRRVKRLGEQ